MRDEIRLDWNKLIKLKISLNNKYTIHKDKIYSFYTHNIFTLHIKCNTPMHNSTEDKIYSNVPLPYVKYIL